MRLPGLPHHSDVKRYLESYAETFDLKRNIRFENGVEHAERLPGGGWQLRTHDGESRRFDALVVANGHHWNPRYPDFPGEFTGNVIHSHHYIDPEQPLNLRDKRIMVVGIGNSAVDVASELSHRALRNTVTLSTRSGAWILPRYVFGIPSDKMVRTIPWLSLRLQRAMVRKVPTLISGNPEKFGLPKPNHHFLHAHPTMSSDLLVRLGTGDLTAKPNVDRLDGKKVHFVDGTDIEVDVIIYATGYNITFPFFDPEFLSAPDNALPLYKRMFKPGIDDLVFIGFAQALPTLFPFVECQSRFGAAYLAGAYRPPAVEEMHRVIAADEKKFIGHYGKSARHTQQLDYFVYEHQLRTKELPQGLERTKRLGPVPLAGRAGEHDLV